jgi:hypothetical protein
VSVHEFAYQRAPEPVTVNACPQISYSLYPVQVENALRKHSSLFCLGKLWAPVLSIFITLLMAYLTTEFHDSFGVSAARWETIFRVLLFGTGFGWVLALVVSTVFGLNTRIIEKILRSAGFQ